MVEDICQEEPPRPDIVRDNKEYILPLLPGGAPPNP